MRTALYSLAMTAVIALTPLSAQAGEAEDTALANRTAKKLQSSGQMKGYKINISSKDGTVWLKGRVTNEEQKQTALRIASSTAGVTNAVDQLEIVPAQPDAASMTSKVKSYLSSSYKSSRRRQTGDVALTSNQQVPGRLAPAVNGQDAAPLPVRAAPRAAAPVLSKPQPQMPMARGPQPQAQPQYSRMAAMPRPYSYTTAAGYPASHGQPIPAYAPGPGYAGQARFDHPTMPNYAWPSYAAHPNYAAVTYPKQYSASAWPYIGPFYPYPQVPLGWRKVTLEWDDGWWMLDFKD